MQGEPRIVDGRNLNPALFGLLVDKLSGINSSAFRCEDVGVRQSFEVEEMQIGPVVDGSDVVGGDRRIPIIGAEKVCRLPLLQVDCAGVFRQGPPRPHGAPREQYAGKNKNVGDLANKPLIACSPNLRQGASDEQNPTGDQVILVAEDPSHVCEDQVKTSGASYKPNPVCQLRMEFPNGKGDHN